MIGEHLNNLLIQRKIVKKEFAKKLEISNLNSILNDGSLSTLNNLSKISLFLDVPSDYFLQDFDDIFLIYAIDGYLSKLDKNVAKTILNDTLFIMGA